MASLAFKVIGIVGLTSYAVAYACAKLPRVTYYRFKAVAVPADALPDMPRGYSSRSLDPAELAEYQIEDSPEVQARRFADGMECLGVFDRKGELAAITWVLPKRMHQEGDLPHQFLLPDNAAWDTGLWVRENRRMGRAFSAAWAATKLWLQKEGLEWSMSSITDYNVPSIISHRRLGALRLGYFTILRVGPIQLTFGARPFLYIEGRSHTPLAKLRIPPSAVTPA